MSRKRQARRTFLGEVVELLEERGNVNDDTRSNEGDALGVDET